MVHSSSARGRGLPELPIRSTRRSTGGGLSGKQNHLDLLFIGDDVDPWRAWRSTLVVGAGADGIADVFSTSTACAPYPIGNTIPASATSAGSSMPGIVETPVAPCEKALQWPLRCRRRVGRVIISGVCSSNGANAHLWAEAHIRPNGKCAAKLASGPKKAAQMVGSP